MSTPDGKLDGKLYDFSVFNQMNDSDRTAAVSAFNRAYNDDVRRGIANPGSNYLNSFKNNSTLGTSSSTGWDWLNNYGKGLGNYITENPTLPFQWLGTGINGLMQYQQNRQNYKLANQAFQFQKQMMQNEEDRTQQRFEWLKQARASSSL